jgi:hypothetical protein
MNDEMIVFFFCNVLQESVQSKYVKRAINYGKKCLILFLLELMISKASFFEKNRSLHEYLG